jgi:hypothetical protein
MRLSRVDRRLTEPAIDNGVGQDEYRGGLANVDHDARHLRAKRFAAYRNSELTTVWQNGISCFVAIRWPKAIKFFESFSAQCANRSSHARQSRRASATGIAGMKP